MKKLKLRLMLLLLQIGVVNCVAQIHITSWDPGSVTPEQKKYLDSCEKYAYDTLGNLWEGSGDDQRRIWLNGNYFEYVEIDSAARTVRWKYRKATEGEKTQRKKFILTERNIDSLIGKKIPEMQFVDLEGNEYLTTEFGNKIVYMNFWFVGCSPCELERVKLNEIYEKYRNNENVIFLSFSNSSERKTRNYLRKKEHLWPIIIMDKGIENNFSFIQSYPTNVISNDRKYKLALRGLTPGAFLVIDEMLELLTQ